MLKKAMAGHALPVAKLLSCAFCSAVLSLVLLLLFSSGSALAAANYTWVFDPETPVWGGMDEPQAAPDIDDDKVVWVGRSSIPGYGNNKDRIFYKDISTPANPASVLVLSTQPQEKSAIDGNLVAWIEGLVLEDKRVHYTTLGADCPGSCTDNTLDLATHEIPRDIAVSGTYIVWSDERPGSSETDIYLFDTNDPSAKDHLITEAPGKQQYPAIDGDWVAWVDDNDTSIVARNLVSQAERQVPDTTGHPSISEEIMAWTDTSGTWLLDLSDPDSEPVQASGRGGIQANIDGSKVVWRTNDDEIYLYDLVYNFEQQLTAGLAPAFHPAISGKRVVWADDRTGPRNIYSLYLRDLISTLASDTCCGEAGDPVNTSTGGFFYPETDIEIATRGLPLAFVRTYNSNDEREGALGIGWSHNWQMSATTMSSGDVVILRGDGRRDAFQDNGDGTYTPPSGRHDALTVDPGNSYTLLTQDQITYNFNGDGQLTSAVAENGQETTLSYDANSRLETITGPAGRTLTLSYTAEDRISGIAAPMGTSVSFAYSATG